MRNYHGRSQILVTGGAGFLGSHLCEQLTATVGSAAAVLSADTGVAHLATALAVPSVVLFGPTPPAWWGPAVDPGLHTVLWHGDPDAGSWGDPHADVLDERLAAVTADEVLAAVRALLERTGPDRPGPEPPRPRGPGRRPALTGPVPRPAHPD